MAEARRPATAKSVSWVDNEHQKSTITSTLTPETGEFSKELEEELNRDQTMVGDDQGPIGCWQKFTALVSSK